MVRRVVRGLAVMLTAMLALEGTVAATPQRPAEEPPADFAGRQYIDSTGCVFLREGKLWVPRLARDGAGVCGYPPTPVGRVQASVARPADGPVPLEGMGRIEAELVTAITANMAPGDWVGSPPEAPDPGRGTPPASDGTAGIGQAMAAAVAAAPAIAAAGPAALPRSALNPSPHLCTLLGMAANDPAQHLGGDPTGGFCSGLVAPALSPRVARAENVAAAPRQNAEAPRARADAATPRRTAADTPVARPAPQAKRSPSPATAPAAQAKPSVSSAAADNLIPAGTRFLQVGTFPDAAAADAAVRRVASLGLPVARSRANIGGGGRTVMAGPFGTREAVVRAHHRLTRAGFSGLLPRR